VSTSEFTVHVTLAMQVIVKAFDSVICLPLQSLSVVLPVSTVPLLAGQATQPSVVPPVEYVASAQMVHSPPE
jgi:hypothetical protein